MKPTSKQLRARAEKRLAGQPPEDAISSLSCVNFPDGFCPVCQVSTREVQKLVHDLHLHQVELEMQNDELRRTQRELEAARDRLMLPYDAAPVGFLTLDAKGVIHEANLAAARLLHLDRIKLAGQKLSRFIAPESQDVFYLHCRQLFNSGEKQTCELNLLRPDGPPLIVWSESVMESAAAEPAPRCLVMLSDITERKQAETRLKAFTEATFEGIVYSEAGRILDCNEQFARMCGRPVAELKGMEIAGLVAPEDRARVMAKIREGREQVIEHAIIRQDGTQITVEAHGVPVSPGSERHYTAIRDITARKQAEAALSKSEARLAAFAEATFEGIVESEGGRIVDCNEQYARMMGSSVAELVGTEIAPLVAPEDRERIMANILQGKEATHEHVMLRKDGTRLVVETHGRPIPGGARRHTSLRDITERKQAEDALRASNEDLARFNGVAVGRELRMIQLKKEINELCTAAGQPPRYRLDFVKDQ